MAEYEGKRVSFPVTVWYDPDTGKIQMLRPTDRGFCASIGPDPDSANGHPTLYRELSRALREGGGFAEPPTKFN